MSTDNRTTLNDCSATTGWTGDDSVAVTTLAGLFFEGSSSLSCQFSNADEYMLTTSIPGSPLDLSDATIWMLVKDNLQETQTNGGIKLVLQDGTDIIGYEIGGNDLPGLPLSLYFYSIRFDVSNSAAFTAHAFAGSEGALAKTAITGVGYGTYHLSKAQGAIDNCFMDRISAIANGSPALTINGGTSGTPETLADVVGDDVTNGWGLVNNPKGSEFGIFCSTEIGSTSANSYFEQVDSQIYLNGEGVTAGNFNTSLIGGGAFTNSFVMTGCVVVNIGTASNITTNDSSVNVMKITDCSFVDTGTITLPDADVGNKHVNNTIFTGCGLIQLGTGYMDNVTFNSPSNALGAVQITGGPDNQTGLIFNSGGTGHAVYITVTGSANLPNWTYNGYDAADETTDSVFYNNSGGAVTLYVLAGGDIPSVRNGVGATTTVIAAAVTVKVTAVKVDGTPIQNARVLLTASNGTGDFPFDETVTISNSGTTATVTHTGHGMQTGDYVQIIEASLPANNGVFSITVTTVNAYTYTMLSTPGSSPTGTIKATFAALYGLTDVNGEVSTTRVYATAQPVTGKTRKSTTSPYFKEGVLTGSIGISTGYDATAVMISDE